MFEYFRDKESVVIKAKPTLEEIEEQKKRDEWSSFQRSFRSGIIVSIGSQVYSYGRLSIPVIEIALERKSRDDLTCIETYSVTAGLWKLVEKGIGKRIAFPFNIYRDGMIHSLYPTAVSQEEVWAMKSMEEYQATYIKRFWEEKDHGGRQQKEPEARTEREEVQEVFGGGDAGKEQGEEEGTGSEEGGEAPKAEG